VKNLEFFSAWSFSKWDFDQRFLSSKWEVSKEHVNFISENEMARKKIGGIEASHLG
jgi:hypothetical protein